ncbi:IS91 family transposase [uncultured Desulfobacter sp.]|uniref:IS91 family transposase n=2 Tax=uncultured Desulfobacter sp. TaxID=240139 RepID=UPI0029F4EEA3|nr:IS91 family transposase [uncultured Desulfobacter sp.]
MVQIFPMKTLCSHTPLPYKPATGPTVGDIFREYGPAFRASNNLHPRQHKVMYDIEHCRRGEFGTHWEICDTCGHLEKGYNSCRNRHCPGCNNIARRKWVAARIDELLPVSYHHCVFTLPDIFNPLCRFNRRVMYDLLFESASQTLLEFGENSKRLGARIGFYGILHTWGGKLWLHPHIHFIVTAGGVNTRGEWMEPKYSSTFLFPVRALSNVFRAKFLNGLITAQGQGLLKLPGDLAQFSSPDAFRQWLFHTVPRDWVVYSKPPFSGPEDVVRYIGRYTHSTAISNNRIISIEDDVVTFWFKNTRKGSRWETTTLPVMEFINRFLIHVLPKHFHRIRYYGFLANGKAGKQIASIRRALGSRIDASPETKQHIEQVYRCPACGNGTMMTILVLDGYGNIVKEVLPVADTQQILIAEGSP